MKIFAFPHAGGDSYCFRDLQKKFNPNEIETLALPGRGKRFSDRRIESIDEMAEEAISQFRLHSASNFSFYGHSMGALIAYRATIKLREMQLPEPKNLFFSGRKGACLNTGKGTRHQLPSKEFREELDSLGGCPKEVLQNNELMELFEPMLRADFKAVETFRYLPTPSLNQKIILFHGIEDHFSKAEILTWQQETTQPLEYHEFNGGHFFIQKEWDSIAKIIKSKI